MPAAKLSNQPDGRAQTVDGSGLQGGPLTVKLLVLLLLCNLALALVRAAPLPIKVPGGIVCWRIAHDRPQGKEPLGKERKFCKKIMQPYI